MGEHKRKDGVERPIEEKWKWEVTKREQFRPEHQTIGVLTSQDKPGTLLEDSHENRYWVSGNREGKPAGIRKLTDDQADTAIALVKAAAEKAEVQSNLLLQRPRSRADARRHSLGLRYLWKRATKRYFGGKG